MNIARLARLAPYLVIAGAATVMLVLLRMPISRLDVPYALLGDAIDKLAQIKNVAETGWLFNNERLGFPFGYDRLDFPRFDSLNYAVLGPAAALTHAGTAMKLYYLAGFYLIAFAAYWSLRRLELSAAPSMLCALLYAFLPYHVIRGVGHLTNSAYFLVPPAIVALSWLALGLLDTRPADARRRLVFAIAIALLVPLQMPYNGVFFAYLAFVAGAIAIAQGGRWRNAVIAVLLVAATGFAFVTEQLPVMLHAREAGDPTFAADRSPFDAEFYALRLNQMLLPTTGDRRPAAAAAKKTFDDELGVPDGESRDQYIGIIGILGFVALMWALCRAISARAPPAESEITKAEAAVRVAALLALAMILLAISSGFGTLIAFWITAKVRTYNRVLPFLAFTCLVGGAWALEAAASRIRPAWLRYAIFAAVSIIALFDVLLKPPYLHRAEVIAQYDRMHRYFEGVEQRLGEKSAVFQLPVSWYPEHAPINAMGDYEEFIPFLLTRTLRFSYGAGHGRPGYNWGKYVESLSPKDAISAAYAKGFAAILIDGRAYGDDTLKALTAAFSGILPQSPSVSADRRWWLFPLDGCCAGVVPSTAYGRDAGIFSYAIGAAPIGFAAGDEGMLYGAGGWDDPESWGMWSRGTHAKLRLRLDPVPRSSLELALDTRMVLGPKIAQREVAVAVNGRRTASATYTSETAAQTLRFEVPAGTVADDGLLELDFETTPEASPHTAGLSGDRRKLGIGLSKLSIGTKDRAP
jgi:phosphoglycerol transferase